MGEPQRASDLLRDILAEAGQGRRRTRFHKALDEVLTESHREHCQVVSFRGGKLIIYSGWSDAAAPGLAVVGYYEDVLAHDRSAAEDVRLFMMPGVEHCFGGPGPSWVNFLTEMDKWVESGDAPEQTTAYWLDEKKQPNGSRPVCAYPNVAKYDGQGDTRAVASFSCGSANEGMREKN